MHQSTIAPSTLKVRALPWRKLGLGVLFAAALLVYYVRLDMNGDWLHAFRPAALELLAGRSPYTIPYFLNAPWALIPLLPLALLPAKLGGAMLLTAGLFTHGFMARRMGADWLTWAAYMSLPAVLFSTNLDPFVALGFILQPRIGLFLVLLKPQIGLPLACYWLYEAVRRGGWRLALHTFAPVSLAFAVSFLIFGFYPLRMLGQLQYTANTFNLPLWPFGVPLGLVLVFMAIRYRQPRQAIVAAPLLTPYSLTWSWPPAVLGLLHNRRLALVVIAALWLIDLLRVGLGHHIASTLIR